ncbi:MBL fold metallo-hydrolase [Kamptonema cortianum]|nr:MBL fold metallo-hydrolase [Geitlerinema splendidum]MDK3157556.1 MBL fold metallo-hydrolase [Kamptonema cortianum]
MLLPILACASIVSPWEIVVLGIAQDAGIPHLGCEKGICAEIAAGKRKPEKVSCIGVRNKETGASYLFDATPDIRHQLIALNGGKKPNGVFITHAHMGHYSGLLYFGRESVDWKQVAVFGSKRMSSFLNENEPWRFIFNRNLDFHISPPDEPISLPDGLTVTPFLVPHRDELSDTYGFELRTATGSAIFIPDIDRWEKWDRRIEDVAKGKTYLFLDGTFSTPDEIGVRSIEDIPHPLIPATRELLREVSKKRDETSEKPTLWFIHINHSNPAIHDDDVVREGMRFPL